MILILFFQVRSSSSLPSSNQDDCANLNDVLPDKPMDQLVQPNQAGTEFMATTSTPRPNVQPLIDRGVPQGVTTRSHRLDFRYLSGCLYFFTTVCNLSNLI
jgi:hypothetical protein